MTRRTPRVMQISALDVVSEEVLLARVASAAPGLVVQLRDPQLEGRELHRLAVRLRDVTRRVGARLIVNDRIDVALAVGADGLHMGRRSVDAALARAALGPDAWLSVSAHSVAEALASGDAIDALLLSPIFAAPGKGPPLGLAPLSEVRARLAPRVALFALGGVDLEGARACLDAGADGVASIRADLTSLVAAGVA
jgi:thiamine-phosphate pyrophosphorylase